MPKPVLSDSLFNADDVATEILQQANLQITNNNLGVSDITSSFTTESSFTERYKTVLFFNGFVFFSGNFEYLNGPPPNTKEFIIINDTTYRPTGDFVAPTVGYQGDNANMVVIRPNGQMELHSNTNQSSSTFYFTVNFVYHVNY